MKKTLSYFAVMALVATAAFASEAASRGRGDALRADGRLEEAVAEYKRALADARLMPSEAGSFGLRGAEPLCALAARHRAEIGGRLSASEGR